MREAQTTLEALCKRVTSGGTPSRAVPEYFGGSIPWVKTGEVKKGFIYETEECITELGLENSSAKLIPPNSLIVAMYGDGDTAGNVAVNKVPVTTNQACCNFIVDPEKADYQFLYYYLKGSYSNLVGLKLGGSQQNLNAATLKRFPVPVVPLDTQKKIAAILTAYDDLIANNQRRIALLESMAEEIYREWFVRMRFPGSAAASFDKGRPINWKPTTLSQVCNFTMGQSPSSEHYNTHGDGLPFHQGVGSYGDRFPVHDTFCSVPGRMAKEGDILFSVRAPVGRLNIADRDLILGRGLASMRHTKGKNNYLFYLLKVSFANEDMIGNGSIFNSVGKDELERFPVLDVPLELIDKFETTVGPMSEQLNVLYRQSEKLKETRDALLPRLISGKLRVDQLDIQFPPSMRAETAEAAP